MTAPGISVPLKMLYEAQGFIVTVVMENKEEFRGKFVGVEDNMNVQLQSVTKTHRNGSKTEAEHVFLRGSMILYVQVPDNLKWAPMFKNFTIRDRSRGLGLGIKSTTTTASKKD